MKPGGFYGFPWSYWGRHVDDRVKPPPGAHGALRVADDVGNTVWRATVATH